jgi:hypothetical protein
MRYLRAELLLVIGTSSSESVLPQMLQKLEQLGCEKSVVGLVVPTGYAFNHDGTCLYFAAVAVFLAQATNTALGWEQQLGLLVVLLLTSKGGAGRGRIRDRRAGRDAGGDEYDPGHLDRADPRRAPPAVVGLRLHQHRRQRRRHHRRRTLGKRSRSREARSRAESGLPPAGRFRQFEAGKVKLSPGA